MSGKLLSVLKDTLVYTVGGAARQLVGVILVPIYTRVFLPAEFGAIDLLTTGLAFLTLLLQMGTDSALGRSFADSEELGERREVASTVFFYSLAVTVAAAALVSVFSGIVADALLGTRIYSDVLLMAVWSLPFTLLFIHYKNVLKWQRKPKAVVLLGLSALILQTGLTIWLVVGLRTGIIGIYFANLVSTALFCGIGAWVTREVHAFRFSRARLLELVQFGGPLVFLGIASYVLTYIDRYFLQFYHGLAAVGFYGLAYKLASFVSLFFAGFQGALGPFVLSTYQDPDAPEVFSRLFDYVAVVYCMAILSVSLFAPELVRIFGTEEYLEAYRAVPLLTLSMSVSTLGGYFSFGISIARRTIHQAWISGVVAALNVGLNFLLIPRFGVMGAATATLASYLVWGVLLMSFSQRFYRVEYRFVRVVSLFVLASGLIAGSYVALGPAVGWRILLVKLGLLALGTGLPFLLRVLRPSEIGDVIRFARGRIGSGRSVPAMAAERAAELH